MVERQDGRLVVGAPMLIGNARALLDAGRPLIDGSVLEVDLSAVSEVDSSALTVILAWMRTAAARGGSLRVARAPAALRSLADLYGVDDVLPLA